jgi:hypothetical protein
MKRPDRRTVVVSGVAALSLLAVDALAGPRRRRVRRRVRRRIRRRIRRRVLWRMVGPRRVFIAPVAFAVGWELALAAERANEPDVIVIVKEVKVVEKREVAIVTMPDGTTKELDVAREDTDDNKKELEGTELALADTSIPGIESEIEEEKEVEE